MATTQLDIGARYPAETYHGRYSPEATWGIILVIPFLVVFLLFVLFPVLYGLWLGSNPASYHKLFADPVYRRTIINTAIFLGVGINLKLFLALLLSAYFASTKPWIRWLGVIFILPWAVPSIPTILSFRWMLNSEWGMLNNLLMLFGWDNPPFWLVKPHFALGAVIAVHIWKYLPFWTLILLAGRMAIPLDYYEAAKVDGATPLQRFTYVTWPQLRNLYLTSTLLSTIWSLGDFNSVYLLTGGGPGEQTHVLATLGIRYAFNLTEIDTGIATVMTALPVLVPLVIILVMRLGKRAQQ
ncbi:MAG: sugar ABC transporter permease [Gammaproteobacteria bacterium]